MRVWITGASSGIGEACAYEYARQGCQLVLTSSSAERLAPVAEKCRELNEKNRELYERCQELNEKCHELNDKCGIKTRNINMLHGNPSADDAKHSESVCVLPFDLANAEGIPDLCRRAWNAFGGLDVVYANAGISQRTKVEDTSMEMVRRIMEINYFAPVAMAQSILPLMIAQGGGHIAVTTSIAGKFGFPLRCAYSSSKHALYGFFETLQAEYFSKGIKVTIVCPGRINTNISYYALDKGGRQHGQLDPGQANGLSASAAARKIVRAINKGRREVLVGQKELLMVYLKRFLPALTARLSRHLSAV